ncbi:MAG: MFS transporter [Alphaproteobacteria bacterium]
MNEIGPGVLDGAAALARRRPGEFRWYMAGYGAYFLGLGINQVLLQYLFVVVLHESAARFSLAQSLIMIPLLIAILFGGAAADRSELRGHLIRMQLLLAVPPLLLAVVVGFGQLSYFAMLAYGSVLGAIQSFVQPARDSLLTNVAQRSNDMDIPRAVAAASAVQLCGQLGGFLLVGGAERVGAVPLLLTFSLALVFAASCTLRTAPTAELERKPRNAEPMMTLLTGGFREVSASETLRTLILCSFVMGIFGAAAMQVIMPIILREVYHGTALTFSFFNFCYVGGTAATALALTYARAIKRQGRAMLLSISGGIVTLIVTHFGPPLYVLFPLVFIWGMCNGIWLSLSRALVQESAPASHRARILAVLTLGNLGGFPIGSLLAGQFIAALGLRGAVLVPPLSFIIVCIVMITCTGMWRFERPQKA